LDRVLALDDGFRRRFDLIHHDCEWIANARGHQRLTLGNQRVEL
jgi:hypothetical protein